LIGFGAGAGELKTLVEGFVVTSTGLRPLGSAEVSAGGGKMPGMLVPVVGGAIAGEAARSAVISGGMNIAQEMGPESMRAAAKRTAEEIAKVLKDDFRKRGWI
jgi:NADPH-dependent 2,4-dienoyl-CoA reductase/sulfur reductase-like enzyme